MMPGGLIGEGAVGGRGKVREQSIARPSSVCTTANLEVLEALVAVGVRGGWLSLVLVLTARAKKGAEGRLYAWPSRGRWSCFPPKKRLL